MARILAVADTYVVGARTEDHGASVPAEGLAAIRAYVGAHLDPACCEALERWVRGESPAPSPAQVPAASVSPAPAPAASTPAAADLPDTLTTREGEVLQLLARRLSKPRIAEALVISRKTVEHHLDHIYGKIGVTSRTAAVAYAVHHGLC